MENNEIKRKIECGMTIREVCGKYYKIHEYLKYFEKQG